jgi:O-antigen ligase
MIGIKPLTGWGLMGVWEHSFEFIDYYARESHGHNLWIGFTVTLGFVGLSLYLYMKTYLFRSLKMLYFRECRLAALLAGIQFLIIGHGIVDFTIMAPQTGILFMASSALITSLAMEYRKLSSYSNNTVYNSLPRVG